MSAQAKQYGPVALALAAAVGVVSGLAIASLGVKLPKPLKGG
jgi:hypothetical protein